MASGMEEAAGGLQPAFEAEQEVRFAVVMYGGVSLAIYINGVAQELFRLVRATAPSRKLAEVPSTVWFSTSGGPAESRLSPTERIYRELGQALPVRGGAAPALPAADAPVRTRFVVDILSGSSAGGINAIFLAKALANQQEFDTLRDLWIKEAEIEDLLRDDRSWAGVEMAVPPPTPPQSLLNGYRLYAKALEALTKMRATEQAPREKFRPSYVEELDLAITATDLKGLSETFELANGAATEQRHRHVFRFSHSAEEATGEEHSDFVADNDAVLALAARCTSSFPAAFEPVLPRDADRVEEGSLDSGWARWFPEHEQAGEDWRKFAFADGGYLDNKPFSYATETLRRRRADVPVERKLVYIEPHPAFIAAAPGAGPAPAQAAGPTGDRPDIFANVAAALVGLPRYETIREDVVAVFARNAAIERLREITFGLEREIFSDGVGGASSTDPSVGPASSSSVYRSLRAYATLDELHSIAMALRRGRTALNPPDLRERLGNEARKRGVSESAALLAGADVAFRGRRLSFLQDRLNDLLAGDDPRTDAMLAVAQELGLLGGRQGGDDPPDGGSPATLEEARGELRAAAEDLRRLKLELNASCEGLRKARRAPHAVKLHRVLAPGSEQERRFEALVAAAVALDGDDTAADYLDAAISFFQSPLAANDRSTSECLESARVPAWIRRLLQAYDSRFEMFDRIALPLSYPDLGETNPVEILRVSPQDAPSLFPAALGDAKTTDPARKLGGINVGHFGAFLSEDWRRNDLLWGRLDAAECIIDALLPPSSREAWRTRLQAAIVREEFADQRGTPSRAAVEGRLGGVAFEEASDLDLLNAFRAGYPAPSPLDEGKMRGVGRRAWTIGFNSLADAADGRGMSGRPLRWIARAGWLAKIASRRVLPGGKRARRFLPRFKLPRLNPFHGG